MKRAHIGVVGRQAAHGAHIGRSGEEGGGDPGRGGKGSGRRGVGKKVRPRDSCLLDTVDALSGPRMGVEPITAPTLRENATATPPEPSLF